MVTSAIDRRDALHGGQQIKHPCRVVATSNITLSGFQTIDGVALPEGDANLRVLVTAQTDTTQNGIYNAQSGPWERAKDFNGNRDVVQGTLIYVLAGTAFASTLWRVTTADPVVIGTSAITFVQYPAVAQDDLAAIEALIGTAGLLAKTAANQWALRTLTAGTGITVTNGTCAGGNPTVALDRLTSNRTYFVRTDGSDSNTGLVDSSSGAFLTWQKAIDTAYGVDTGGFSVIIQQGTSGVSFPVTYTSASENLMSLSKPLRGGGTLDLRGDLTTPANVILSQTGSANCVIASRFIGDNRIRGFQFQAAGDTVFEHQGIGKIALGNSNFAGAGSGGVLSVQTGGGAWLGIDPGATITISRDGAVAVQNDSGYLINEGQITFTGTRAYSDCVFDARFGSFTYSNLPWTTTGSVTGRRALIADGCTVRVGTGGQNHFVGSTAMDVRAGALFTDGTAANTLGPVKSGLTPATVTDNAAVRWDGTVGSNIQNSPLIIADTTGALSRNGGGGIPVQGTNTNNTAAAGDVGEYFESVITSGSAVSLTTATPANITSISLTAGDWDVSGEVTFITGASTNVTSRRASASTTTATLDLAPSKGGTFAPHAAGLVGASTAQTTVQFGPGRFSFSGTTTVFLVAEGTFTVSTLSAFGIIRARRVR